MTRSIRITPDQTMRQVLDAVKIAAGDDLVIDIPADASVLLTANEFRALSIAAERDDIDVSIYTDDPLRRQLATLFGVPLVNEIPAPMPYVAPEPEPSEDVSESDLDDGALATEEVEPRAVSRRPDSNSGWPKWLAAIAGVAALAALGIGLYWYFFSTMTVRLQLERVDVASTLAYQVTAPGTAPEAGTEAIVIPGQAVQFTVSRSMTAPATGQTVVPDQAATGQVVLRNPSEADVTIERGFSFEGFNGVTYVFDDAVTVPAAADGRPGEATANVSSPTGGEAGNTGIGMLTGRLPNGIYYSNRMEDISGGTQKVITTVTQEDLDRLRAALDAELLALATTTRLDQGLLLVPSSVQSVNAAGSPSAEATPYRFDHAVGDEASDITLEATVVFAGIAYDPTTLTEAAAPQLRAEAQAGQTLDPASIQVNTPAEVGNANGVISLLATVSGQVVPTLDEAARAAIADQLAGSNEAEIDAILRSLDGVESYSISYQPAWLPDRVPSSADRIEIVTS